MVAGRMDLTNSNTAVEVQFQMGNICPRVYVFCLRIDIAFGRLLVNESEEITKSVAFNLNFWGTPRPNSLQLCLLKLLVLHIL
jgi:hypothetical protein